MTNIHLRLKESRESAIPPTQRTSSKNAFLGCAVLAASLMTADAHTCGTTNPNANSELISAAKKYVPPLALSSQFLGLLLGVLSMRDNEDPYACDRDRVGKKNREQK